MINYYPEKRIVKHMRTSVEMSKVIGWIRQLNYPVEVKIAAYMVFRKESGNGRSGVNNNYSGFQADAGRWPSQYDSIITGVVQKTENGTGKSRYFLAFDSAEGSLNMLMGRLQARGLFVGGRIDMERLNIHMDIPDVLQFARAYKKSWAAGDANAEPSQQDIDGFESMYKQAIELF